MSVKYRTIVADPPWDYPDGMPNNPKGKRNNQPLPYPSMNLAEIAALDVSKLSAHSARLFLWTTNRYLPLAFTVLNEWGFEYRQTITWHKTGNPSPFGGSVAPIHSEFLLVASRGKPERLARWGSSVIAANVGRHSVKPEIFLDLIEQVSPGPYLELFARRARLGWDVWGNEVESDVELAA